MLMVTINDDRLVARDLFFEAAQITKFKQTTRLAVRQMRVASGFRR